MLIANSVSTQLVAASLTDMTLQLAVSEDVEGPKPRLLCTVLLNQYP